MEKIEDARDMHPQPTPQIEKQGVLKPAFSILGAHVGGIIISLILSFGLASLMANMGLLLCIPLALLIYSMPVYGTLWAMGLSDKNKANFGHIILDKWRGAKLALVAMSPWLLSALLFILSKCGLFWNFTVLYRMMNAEVWPVMNAAQVFSGQQVSMYLPDFTWPQVIICALAPFLPVLVAEFGYYMGTRDISITQTLIYSNRKKEASAPKTTYQQYQERQRHGTAPINEKPKEKTSLLHKIMYQKEDEKK